MVHRLWTVLRGTRRASPGQAVVEAALAFTIMMTLLLGVISAGQLINYNISLANAASTAALQAAIEADKTNGTPSSAAVSAVNQEQGVSSWSACTSSLTPPCVAVTSSTQSTGTATSVTVEQITLHGSFNPLFTILGVTLPVTVSATAGT